MMTRAEFEECCAQYNGQAVDVWFAIIVVIAMLASVLPARSATRSSVRQSLAYA
jgi:ABC-type lipoprotein release transport system permease subunit